MAHRGLRGDERCPDVHRDCGLFIDESKNRSRRWCSMDDCGTAEKIRRYVEVRRIRTRR
ncbi:CGNR zinc finger domain-containing protein [Micromonospora chalcea]|uniref:CGNR zinc finger domain-containing protein n=1 Tax=Micromonospora chalcea TaxID=1874 RepID=UPI003D739E61